MAARGGHEDRGLAHPRVVTVVAAVALLGSWLVARARPVPGWEIDLTRGATDAPDWVAHGLWPVMQLGTLAAPIVLAVVVGLLRRDWLLAGCVLLAGGIAWFGARIVKDAVGRARPREYIPDLVVRDGAGHGLGYLSGHSAVAAATLTVVMVALPRPARPWVVAVIALVGVARVVHGVHFPADVVGGWAFGALIGVGVVAAYDRMSRRFDAGPAS